MVTTQTKNCVICYKEAVCWTGHVHHKDGELLAGWCELHRNIYNEFSYIEVRKNCIGCFGRFIKPMGIEPINE